MRSPELIFAGLWKCSKNEERFLPARSVASVERLAHRKARGGGMTELTAGWQLLRHAVNRAEAEHQIAAVDRHNFTVGKEFCQIVESDAVVRVVEHRNEH